MAKSKKKKRKSRKKAQLAVAVGLPKKSKKLLIGVILAMMVTTGLIVWALNQPLGPAPGKGHLTVRTLVDGAGYSLEFTMNELNYQTDATGTWEADLDPDYYYVFATYLGELREGAVNLGEGNLFTITLSWSSGSSEGYWENPYVNWGLPGYSLWGGQGEHLHVYDFAQNGPYPPDASVWCTTSWTMNALNDHVFNDNDVAGTPCQYSGYPNTNGGYEWLMWGCHSNKRGPDEITALYEYVESIGPSYGYEAQIRAIEGHTLPNSEPHEGGIFNGWSRTGYPRPQDTADASGGNDIAWVNQVVALEDTTYHSIAVILHPQCGNYEGQNTFSEALALVNAGAELIEIFNGGWEGNGDWILNDHQHGSAGYTHDGNAESTWDYILSRGQRVWGVGADDWHGRGGNWVWTEILAHNTDDAEDLVRRLERGEMYVTQGVQIEEIRVTADEIYIRGDSTVDYIEAIGSEGGPVALKPEDSPGDGDGDRGTLLMRSTGREITYRQSELTEYDNVYVRFRLVNTDAVADGLPNRWYDEHQDGGGDVYAFTQPFFWVPESNPNFLGMSIGGPVNVTETISCARNASQVVMLTALGVFMVKEQEHYFSIEVETNE